MARSASESRGRALGGAVTGSLLGVAALAALATLGAAPFGAGFFEGRAPTELASELGGLAGRVATAAAEARLAAEAEAEAKRKAAAEAEAKKDTKGWAVPRQETPLEEVAIARMLRQGHELELGERPSEERLGVAWAHIALENARGEGIENHNFGNLTIWEKEPGAHFVRILRERRPVTRGSTVTRWRWVEMRFRAFETPVEGARAYWAHLVNKFPGALERFDFGDAKGAGRKLARLGYASAFSMSYASSLDNLYDEYRRRIAPRLDDTGDGESAAGP
jgi:hypothetical protein